jgi:hypothetical protein
MLPFVDLELESDTPMSQASDAVQYSINLGSTASLNW